MFLRHQQQKWCVLWHFTCSSIIVLIIFYCILNWFNIFEYILTWVNFLPWTGTTFYFFVITLQLVQCLKQRIHGKYPLNYMIFNVVFSFSLIASFSNLWLSFHILYLTNVGTGKDSLNSCYAHLFNLKQKLFFERQSTQ